MNEVSGPVVAIALVLSAVFIPTAFIGGISGQFYRQFAITIAAATIISAFNSLTLSPALCALMLRPHGAGKDRFARLWDLALGWFFRLFNRGFTFSSHAYAGGVRRAIRLAAIVLVGYVGLLLLTGTMFRAVPTGFIPQADQSLLITAIQLPDWRLAGTHRRRGTARRTNPPRHARHRAYCRILRLFRRDADQLQQRGRDLRRAEAVRGACASPATRCPASSTRPSSASPTSRKRRSSSSRRPPCAASERSAASRSRSRTPPVRAALLSRLLPASSLQPPIKTPLSRASSRFPLQLAADLRRHRSHEGRDARRRIR